MGSVSEGPTRSHEYLYLLIETVKYDSMDQVSNE